MANTNPLLANSRSSQSSGVNPFAKALADTEREKNYSNDAPPQSADNNLFSQALANKGGALGDYAGSQNSGFDQSQAMAEQQLAMENQRKKEALRRRLHDQVNPVDRTDIFDARQQQVKREIDGLRQELKLLVKDVASFQKEVELTLMTEVVDPGEQGTYYKTFFQQLRSFIMLLRARIKSAQTWATQMSNKKQKKQKKGLMIGGMGYEKTSTIQDMMHHERSSQYSGG